VTKNIMLTDRFISVVVPCYRDECNIREMVGRLTEAFQGITPNYEIIYVNDASPDNSEAVLAEVAKNNPRVTVVHHSRNFGVMSAFHTGMRQTIGDAVAVMDGDLQDPPEVIGDFVKKWLGGYQVVYGIRASRDESWLRKIGYYWFYKLWAEISEVRMPRDSGEFALMDRKVVDLVLSMPEKERFLRGLRSWVGFAQIGVPYHRPDRFAGKTTQTLWNYFSWAIKATTSFSSFPLRMISVIAVMFSAFLVAFLAVNLALFVMGVRAPRGFMTLLGLLLLIGTMISICNAIMAEYINVIFQEVKARPTSIVSYVLNDHRTGKPL